MKDSGSEVFVNTSVSFFDDYAYLYDYVNGQVGYLANVPAPLPLVGIGTAFPGRGGCGGGSRLAVLTSLPLHPAVANAGAGSPT